MTFARHDGENRQNGRQLIHSPVTAALRNSQLPRFSASCQVEQALAADFDESSAPASVPQSTGSSTSGSG